MAIIAVLACMVAKMFLAMQTKALEKKLSRLRDVYHEVRREQGMAAGKLKLLDAESRQLDGKKKRSTKKISTYSKSLGGYAEVEQKEREKAQAQQELVKQANAQK